MPLRNTEIGRCLVAKFGFECKVGDHWFYERRFANGITVRTKVSHSRYETDASLEALMAKQLHVDRKTLIGMVSCTVSAEQYEELLGSGSTGRR